MVKELKTAVTQATADVRRFQGEEAALNQDISAEQGRWTEINQRLEELERHSVVADSHTDHEIEVSCCA